MGGNEAIHVHKEGGSLWDKISKFVSKGEKVFVNMTNTLQEMSQHGKKLSAVVETVKKFKADIKDMKRKYLFNASGTSKKGKTIETSENEASSDNDDEGKGDNPGDIADIFS